MQLHASFFNHDAQAGGFYPKSHAGIDIRDLALSQNILIEGIRGTGKTHVLRMLERYYLDNYKSLRVLPIYVSLAQITEHARKVPEEFRLHLCTHIVQRAIDAIEANKEYLRPDANLFLQALRAIMKLFNLQTQPELEVVIKAIKEVAEELNFQLQFDLTNENLKRIISATEGLEGSGGVAIGTKSSGVEASAKATDSISESREQALLYVGSRLAHRNAAQFIIEFLRQIQVLLDLKYSALLLDECSEASTAAQVEIFRLFKTIRGARAATATKDACAFFVGSVYPQGETYYPTRDKDGFSFEPGQDCTLEFLQWDETDLDTYRNFFEEMTLSRAREVLGYVGDFERLRSLIFDSNNGFLLAAYCAHGIPRRYWEILKRAHDRQANIIPTTGIDIAIQEIANNGILTLGHLSEDDMEFMNDLTDRLLNKNVAIRSKNSRTPTKAHKIPQNIYFTLTREFTPKIRRLVMQGAIHDKARMRNVRKRAMQPVYAMDLALVYTFRVIPQKSMVSVITTDIPRIPVSGFDQAFDVKSKVLSGIYEKAEASGVGASVVLDEVTTKEGAVKWWGPRGYGFIRIADESRDLFFHVSNVDHDHIDKLVVGARVAFVVGRNKDGLQAIKVRVLNAPKFIPSTGLVRFYREGHYGFISVDDGGPDAIFFVRDIRSSIEALRIGARVSFQLSFDARTRQACDIVLAGETAEGEHQGPSKDTISPTNG